MNILITGGAGFVGSQVGHYLEGRGHTVYLFDNMSYGHVDNLSVNGQSIGEFIKGDVREYCDHLLREKEIEAVLHFAGVAPLLIVSQTPITLLIIMSQAPPVS